MVVSKKERKPYTRVREPKPDTVVIACTQFNATPAYTTDEREIAKSWNMVIGEVGRYGTVIDYSDGYRQTPSLTRFAIRICVRCGMLQPMEQLICKGCGE